MVKRYKFRILKRIPGTGIYPRDGHVTFSVEAVNARGFLLMPDTLELVATSETLSGSDFIKVEKSKKSHVTGEDAMRLMRQRLGPDLADVIVKMIEKGPSEAENVPEKPPEKESKESSEKSGDIDLIGKSLSEKLSDKKITLAAASKMSDEDLTKAGISQTEIKTIRQSTKKTAKKV